MNKYILIFSLIATLFPVNVYSYDIIVSGDSKGDFTTINEAIMSVRDYKPEGRTIIFIHNGIYNEKILIPANKTNIVLIGENRDSTIIQWNDNALKNNMGTFNTYTLRADGNGFEAHNITIQNNAPQTAQAVALHIEADRSIVRNCNILGFQDTVFNGNETSRQYFENCYIEGTTDFIFGPATVWYEKCKLHSLKNSYITAASTPRKNPYGLIFNNCILTSAPGINKVYLGRPWRPYAYTLFMNTEIYDHIKKEIGRAHV